ncbi:MAG: EAL domain-containing protein [Novosphingobium sp.]|nr:EAL domain-containing protein [Novosphingobium sp.]
MIVLVASALGALAGGLLWLTALQNEAETLNERDRVRAALTAEMEAMATTAKVFSVWDDAASKLLVTFDRAWAKINIADYLHDQYHFEMVFITDAQGRAIFASIDGNVVEADPVEFLGRGYRNAADLMMMTRSSPIEPIVGVSVSPRGPLLFGISKIRSHTPGSTPLPAIERFLVTTKLIDGKVLNGLTKAATNPSLALQPTQGNGVGIWKLRTFDGQSAGFLTWTPLKPGDRLRQRTLPWLITFGLAIFAIAAGVLIQARRASAQLRASETKALYLASRDSLTGLPNRRAFTDELLRLSRSDESYTLLYMDLDGFKDVNDTFGHGVGDKLLCRTGERLQRHIPPQGFLARLGGDEFALTLDGTFSSDRIGMVAARLVAAVGEPHELGGEPIVIGVSIGIASSQNDDYEDVIRHADVAMYASKARGRDGWSFYDSAMETGRSERKQLEIDLRHAITAGEITVVYQPIVSARDNAMVSVEALARWSHPTKGAISPDVFIPIAEESGLIVELGRFILDTACAAARDWPVGLAVNLSPAQFWDRTLVDDVCAALKRHGFPPERLEFEITETYLLRRPELAEEIISRLRKLQIRIALDDFGTGYASIGYLRRFELDLVKIDRSLVENLSFDRNAIDVLTAIMSLCRALNLPILAEGVETKAQAAILTAAGCSFMQGWYYGHPVSAEEMNANFIHAKPMAA